MESKKNAEPVYSTDIGKLKTWSGNKMCLVLSIQQLTK